MRVKSSPVSYLTERIVMTEVTIRPEGVSTSPSLTTGSLMISLT